MKSTIFSLKTLLIAVFLCSCTADRNPDAPKSADPRFTSQHIQDIALTQPEEALALLDTAEALQLLSPFDISDLRCLVYHNGLSDYKTAFFHACKAYEDPQARQDAQKFLSLVSTMADECYQNGDYPKSLEYCAEGMKTAQETANHLYEAKLHVLWGMNLWTMEQLEQAGLHIDKALVLLEEECQENPGYASWDELCYTLGMKASLLWDLDSIDEILALRPRLDKALQGIKDSKDSPEGIFDMRRAQADIVFCNLAYSIGNKEEAERLFRQLEANPYISSPNGEEIRILYLLMTERYDEALRHIERLKEQLRETTDTLSWDYINPWLQCELEAYIGKEDWKSANEVQSTMLSMTETLRQKELDENALELAEIYKTNAQARKIEQQQTALYRRNVFLVASGIILLLAILYIVHILRSIHATNQKNAAMANTINELMAYKEELFLKQEEILRLREQLNGQESETANASTMNQEKPDESEGKTPSPTGNEVAAMADEDEENGIQTEDKDSESTEENKRNSPKLNERDRMAYDRMIHKIHHQKLYLNPELNKKELTAAFHIPANKFASMFKEFAGCSFNQYIQECRLDHAVRLMREQPQWSFDAIAKDSQMSKSAFYDQFFRKYGMKPSEFRKKNHHRDQTGKTTEA